MSTNPTDLPASLDRLPFRAEIARKSIHLATVGVPLAAWFLPWTWALALLVVGAVTALSVEWARRELRWARYAFLTRTRGLLRGHERRGIAGATYMAVAYLVAFLIFPLAFAVTAMLYNGLGDASAAVVGKRWGRHRIRSGKSWEGAATALAVNTAVGLVVPGIPVAAAVAGGAGAALIEMAPIPVDDNVLVTLFGGAVLWAATAMAIG